MLTIFHRPVKTEDTDSAEFAVTSESASTSGTVTVSGCIPDREYEIHAVLSDKPPAEATIVSTDTVVTAKSGA